MLLAFAQKRFENFFQRPSPAEDARLDRADAAFQNFGDLFVAESFDVAEYDSATENIRNLMERALHRELNFVRSELLKRCGTEIFDFDVRRAFFRFRVDGDVLLQVALEPPFVIQRFANGEGCSSTTELCDAVRV